MFVLTTLGQIFRICSVQGDTLRVAHCTLNDQEFDIPNTTVVETGAFPYLEYISAKQGIRQSVIINRHDGTREKGTVCSYYPAGNRNYCAVGFTEHIEGHDYTRFEPVRWVENPFTEDRKTDLKTSPQEIDHEPRSE